MTDVIYEIPPALFCNGKRRLSIYDFDGTLFRTHDRATGEVAYFVATGNLWPYQGWYGRRETLLPPIIPDPIPKDLLIAEVYEEYRKDFADRENTHVVLMTGRPVKLRKRIQEIFSAFDLRFDEEYYRGMKGMSRAQDTFDIKADIIRGRLLHPTLEEVHVWEDRAEHIGRFTALAGELRSLCPKLGRVAIHDVPNRQCYEL